MGLVTKEIEYIELPNNEDMVVILPFGESSDDLHRYSSTTISFWKYAKNKIDIEFYSEPKELIEQRSGEWFGPTLLISATLLANNSAFTSILLNVISNYLYDYLKTNSSESEVKFKLNVTETKAKRTIELSYEGSNEGVKAIEGTIQNIVNKSNENG
ncbi:hypothetical protein [Pseudoalteromonas piscicida]|uniref:hypothetical protein n=1 Tax=Pseudoalteromonas piscicida TaxID=43662 RepID=UPI0030AD3366